MTLTRSGAFALLLLLNSVAFSAEPKRPGFAPARQEEDWSQLREPALRTGALDGYKYIPLEGEGRTALTLGGELRLLQESYENEANGRIPGTDSYLLTRAMAHASLTRRDTLDLDRLRLWVELKGGYVSGRDAPARPPDRDDADFNGLFVEATERVGTGDVTLRLGRQEFHYGSARLVSVREGPTTRRGFDGALLRWRTPELTLDVFAAQPNETDPGAFDNGADDTEDFWGAYAVLPFPGLPNFKLDLIYFGNDRPAIFSQGPGIENRHTAGLRWHTAQGSWRHDLLAVSQFGTFRSQPGGSRGDIRSWTLSTDTSYRFASLPLTPRPGIFIGYTPGDDNPDDPDLQTFRAPYPPGRYLVTATLLGPENLVFLQSRVELALASWAQLLIGNHWLWRESLEDGLYGTAGNLITGGAGSRARTVGTIQQVQLDLRVDQYLSFALELAHLEAGRFLRESTPGENIDYAGLRMTFRF